jgi:hydroxymethylpyrimidine/phosphomethylpyrimidine kinase
LTIAGSDSSGGAGVQADLKTFAACGVYGASVITALTAQNTLGVQGVHVPPAAFIALQMQSVLSDLSVKAIKTGMLANAQIIDQVAKSLHSYQAIPLIVDPVMVSTSGHKLLESDAMAAMIERLMPLAALVTPNLHEAALLSDLPFAQTESDILRQGEVILRLGAKAVLIKGGHGDGRQSVDHLFTTYGHEKFSAKRIDTKNTHGTGCTLSAAIAAHLALGLALAEAIAESKTYLTKALQAGVSQKIGAGFGPPQHFFNI